MAGKFKQQDVDELLAKCHRRCCICHRFCGCKIETDHIEQPMGEGSNDIENAIVVCFECHAEIHSYNDRHLRGRKFHPAELREYKRQWLKICRTMPQNLIQSQWNRDVGPLQGLIDELEFNGTAAEHGATPRYAFPFLYDQFKRAIEEGCIATIAPDLKTAALDAYAAMLSSNRHISALTVQLVNPGVTPEILNDINRTVADAKPKIQKAKEKLLCFLGTEK